MVVCIFGWLIAIFFGMLHAAVHSVLCMQCIQASSHPAPAQVYQALANDNTGLVSHLHPRVACATTLAWQSMRLQHEALVTDVMLALNGTRV